MSIIDLNSEVLNVQNVIGTTLFGEGSATMRDASRVPMAFTSTRRLRLVRADFDKLRDNPLLSATGTVEQLAEDIQQLQETDVGGSKSDLPVIQMLVNPNSISWKQPKRITKKDTQEGSIFFHFTNARGQNNDILTMSFRGNTGNINLTSDASNEISGVGFAGAQGENTNAVKKLIAWHNLWNLTREPILLIDDNTVNEFMITYSSAAIPTEIMLVGFFSSVLEWEDSAEKPNSKDYSFDFTIKEVIPDIDDLVKTISTFSAAV